MAELKVSEKGGEMNWFWLLGLFQQLNFLRVQ